MADTISSATIDAWEDDPIAAIRESRPPMNTPVPHPRPDMDVPRLPVAVGGTAPAVEIFKVGTPEFRYWVLADAMARGAGFWSACVPDGTTWQASNGPRLIAFPDEDVDLNAYYDRHGVHFFHDTIRGVTVYSGESPDVVCHELGHAVLDAVKPQLWNAATIEAAAFHESFGDISAILSALMLPSMRAEVLEETGGAPSMASRLSRVAENLGWAIRQLIPDSGDAGCLRSAVNSFYYQAPATLPPRAPASNLSSEPHNFSRVFTAGFFRMLGGVFAAQPQHTSDSLRQAALDAGKLLIEGVRKASVLPAFYAQVAAGILIADQELFQGRYRRAIRSGFVGTGVLSVSSAASVPSARTGALPSDAISDAEELPVLPLTGSRYGLPAALLVHGATQPQRVDAASGRADSGDAEPPAADKAADSFVEDLIRRGRIAADEDVIGDAPIMPTPAATHEIRPADGVLELVRTRFDCGFAG